jgi:hypothetical protein
VISTANSNKFQKTRFWKEGSVEDMVTLGPTAQATLVYIKKCLKAKEKIMKTQIFHHEKIQSSKNSFKNKPKSFKIL